MNYALETFLFSTSFGEGIPGCNVRSWFTVKQSLVIGKYILVRAVKDKKWWNSFAADKSAIFDIDEEKNVGNISISNSKKSDDWNR